MPIARRIQHLPRNFGAFVEEISDGMAQVYGPAAAAEYRESGAERVLATIGHPGVIGLATVSGEDAHALLMALIHEGVGQIFFLHVLRGHESGNPERTLLVDAVQRLRGMGVKAIACESLIFNPEHPCEALEELDFRKFERAIMRGPLDASELTLSSGSVTSRPLKPSEFEAAAHCLVAAYRGEPGADLHREMHSMEGALGLIESVAGGSFGVFRPEYARCVEAKGEIASVLFGCEAVSKVGFVVQVGTPRPFRGRGYARLLLKETARAFRLSDLEHIALGVTLTNPALRLYEDLGMTIRKHVDAYVWWPEGNEMQPADAVGD